MDKVDFDYDFYLVTLRTADAVGMTVVKKDDLHAPWLSFYTREATSSLPTATS